MVNWIYEDIWTSKGCEFLRSEAYNLFSAEWKRHRLTLATELVYCAESYRIQAEHDETTRNHKLIELKLQHVFQCIDYIWPMSFSSPMHEITICAAADVVELHQIAFPCFRSLSLHNIFRSRSTILPWAVRSLAGNCARRTRYLYLQVSLQCPASGTWTLRKQKNRLDSLTIKSIYPCDLRCALLPDNIRLHHCCLHWHGESSKRINARSHRTKNHHIWNCPPPRKPTSCLQRRSPSATCRPYLLRFRWTPASD